MPDTFAARVEESLRPILGSTLALVSVTFVSRSIGKTVETISTADSDDIAEVLTYELERYVGIDLAEAAGQRVRALQ